MGAPIVKIVDEKIDDDDYAGCGFAIVVYINGEERISYPYESSSERCDQLINAVDSIKGELEL